ncbi:MAG: AtpZ/AtpI family protein [Candidatus Magasanikbacteria bacterium]|nr:AtpZ/AtpI family protein [Candidatus Magasanikbacteria bacterium]
MTPLEKSCIISLLISCHMQLSERSRRSYLLGLKIASDFGASIAIPVVAFVVLGKWLQQKYGFAPYGIIGGFVVAATLTTTILRRKVRWYAAEYKALESDSNK